MKPTLTAKPSPKMKDDRNFIATVQTSRLRGSFRNLNPPASPPNHAHVSVKEPPVAIVTMVVDTARMAARPDELIPTRASLLSRIKDWEDRESWQDFFDTYWRLIYGTARKAGLSDAEAQDIVQETVISVAKNVEGFKYDPAVCSFKRWMLQLTRWRILNQVKKRNAEAARLVTAGPATAAALDKTALIDQIPDPTGGDLEATWDSEWERHLLSAALERVKRRVDPAQFQIFDLYCNAGWPVLKVAQTLGVNVGQVYLIKHRVSRMLRKEVELLERGLA
jgi:RNA polymerase sigma-70 factor (ECF subfamily)